MRLGFTQASIEAVGGNWTEVSDFNAALERLAAMRRDTVEVDGLLRRSKLAWISNGYMQTGIYRTVALAQGTADMWALGNIAGAALCARSLTETVAVIYDFRNQLRRLCDDRDIPGMGQLTVNRAFGTKKVEWLTEELAQEAVNVMTMLKKLDKVITGIMGHYASLSEFCHPNYSGQFGLYATLDHDTGTTTFSAQKMVDVGMLDLLLAPLMMVGLIENAARDVEALLPKITEIHEAYITASPT